jgi:hypothetical protein
MRSLPNPFMGFGRVRDGGGTPRMCFMKTGKSRGGHLGRQVDCRWCSPTKPNAWKARCRVGILSVLIRIGYLVTPVWLVRQEMCYTVTGARRASRT